MKKFLDQFSNEQQTERQQLNRAQGKESIFWKLEIVILWQNHIFALYTTYTTTLSEITFYAKWRAL